MISELEEYAANLPPKEREEANATKMVVQFLKACNKIFERGVLGKGVFIKDISSPIIQNMDEGFKFFSLWLDQKLSKGTYHLEIKLYIW